MKRIITSFIGACLCLCANFLFAQNQSGTIQGKVFDPEGQPVDFANVVLQSAVDSSMVKVEYTNADGAYKLIQIPAGEYQVSISYVGLPPYLSEAFQLSAGEDKNIPDINLKSASNDLTEVVVTAERPLLELKADKMVFNVDGSINATGYTAFELLRKSPGIVVDNNDNITMLGRSGVQIYIDGKLSPLSAADLAAFLKSVQSTEIDAIEIITSPSAKYDAEGNAGIINIKMKKDKRLGSNANMNLGYSIGQVPQYNGTISGNYRNQKMNAFGSYTYSDNYNRNVFNLYREQNDFTFDQRNLQKGENKNHNFRAGTDFFLDDKNTLGFLVTGFLNDNHNEGNSRTPIGMVGNPGIDSVLVAQSIQDGSRNNLNFNINYQFAGKENVTWNIDADYGMFRNEGEEYQPNRYYDASETEILQERINQIYRPSDIDILTLKADHERPLWGGQLGAGVKFARVTTDNTFGFYELINDELIRDIDRSNRFEYTENVNAAYASYRKQIKKLGIQLGLRMEHTHSIGDLTSDKPTENDYVERDYVDFFPSAGISYALNEKHNFQLSYSRRINRPSYQDLNPFENKLDELTFEQGNPFLQPEYANAVQLTHSFNYKLNTTLSFSHTKDLITRITDTSGEKASYITWLNLANQYNYSISLGAPIPITEWWSTFTNATGFYTKNEADYGEGRIVDLDVYAFNVFSQHTFKLPWDLSMEVSGWYNSPGLWGGTFEMESMWSIDAGIQKKVLDGRGNLRLGVSDIFRTNQWAGTSQFGELFIAASGNWDSRRFKANFTYMFGNTQVKGARKRKTGLEEEKGRVKG